MKSKIYLSIFVILIGFLMVLPSVSAYFATLSYSPNLVVDTNSGQYHSWTASYEPGGSNCKQGKGLHICPLPPPPEEIKVENPDNSYPVAHIDDWFGILGTKETIQVLHNDKYCITNCQDKIIITLSDDKQNPLEELKFRDSSGNYIEYTGLIQEQIFQDVDVEVPDFENDCYPYNDINGTANENCTQVQTGTHTETQSQGKIIDYNPLTIASAGEHTYYISANKKPNEKLDYVLCSMGQCAEEMAWWDTTYSYYQTINISNTMVDLVMRNTTTINMSVNTSTLCNTGKMQNDCDDLRIVFNDTLEMDRLIENCNSTTTHVVFGLRENITANSSIVDYKMYYGNPTSANPPVNDTLDRIYIWKDDMKSNKGGWWGGSPSWGANGMSISSNNNWNNMLRRNISFVDDLYMTGNSTTTGNNWGILGYRNGLGTDTMNVSGQSRAIARDSMLTTPPAAISDCPNQGYSANQYTNWTFSASRQNAWLMGGSCLVNHTNPTGTGYTYNIIIGTDSTQTFTINNLLLRSFYYTAPTITFGSEQAKSGISINYVSPANSTNTTSSTPSFQCNFTAIGQNISSVAINVTNSMQVYANTESSLALLSYNKTWTATTIADGIYNWSCIGYGNLGVNASAFGRGLTIDSTFPAINIVYPLNSNHLYNINISALNYTVSDTHLQGCKYSLNFGVTNTSIACGTNATNLVSVEGANNWTVYANDTFGNINKSQVNFFKDTIIPQLGLVTPVENAEQVNNLTVDFLAIAVDDNLANITIRIYNGTALEYNVTSGLGIGANNFEYTLPDYGTHFWNATACDILNNCNNSITGTISLAQLYANITAPENNYTSYSNPVEFNCSANITGNKYNITSLSLWTNQSGAWQSVQQQPIIVYNYTQTLTTDVGWTTGFPWTTKYGQRILIGNSTLLLSSVTKAAVTNPTQAYIQNINGSITYANASFTGDVAIFSPEIYLIRNTAYRIVVDAPYGLPYIRLYKSGAGLYPAASTWLNFTGDQDGNAEINTFIDVNVTLAKGTFFENINHPTDWTCRACSDDGTCIFANVNWTVNPYSIPPTINIIYPTSNSGVIVQTINYSISSLADLSSCWIENRTSPDVNTSISCSGAYINITGLEGNNNYTIWANDTFGNINHANINFIQHILVPQITLIAPIDYYNSSSQSVTLSADYNFNHGYGGNMYYTVYKSGTLYASNVSPAFSSGDSGTYAFSNTYSDGIYSWNASACDTYGAGFCNSTSNRTFTVDTTTPAITITSPAGAIALSTIPYTLNLNYTAIDTNLQSCWYSLDGNTNISLPGCANSTVTINNGNLNHTIVVYANDPFGHTGSSSTFITLLFVIDSQIYNNPVTSLSTQTFIINFSYDHTSYNGITATLNYNGVNYGGAISDIGANTYATAAGIIAPTGTIPFYWTITLSGMGVPYTATSGTLYQTVNPLTIDNCSNNTYMILNYTLYDEDSDLQINNSLLSTSSNYDVKISALSDITQFTEYTGNTNLSNFQFCLPASNNSYRLDSAVQYKTDTKVERYNYIQNQVINNSPVANVILRDLNSSLAIAFNVVYTSSSFLPQAQYLLTVQRFYTNQNSNNKTIETSITDNSGTAQAYFTPNVNYYQIIVTKDGKYIETFNIQQAKCQNTPCTINIATPGNIVNAPSINVSDNLRLYGIAINKSDIFTLSYLKTNSQPSTILLIFDTGNSPLFNFTSIGTTGSFLLNLTAYAGKTLFAEVFQDNNYVANFNVQVPKPSTGLSNGGFTFIIMGALMFVILWIMGYTDNLLMVALEGLGFFILGALSIFQMGHIFSEMSIFTMTFMAIALVIMIFKLSTKRDQG